MPGPRSIPESSCQEGFIFPWENFHERGGGVRGKGGEEEGEGTKEEQMGVLYGFFAVGTMLFEAIIIATKFLGGFS